MLEHLPEAVLQDIICIAGWLVEYGRNQGMTPSAPLLCSIRRGFKIVQLVKVELPKARNANELNFIYYYIFIILFIYSSVYYCTVPANKCAPGNSQEDSAKETNHESMHFLIRPHSKSRMSPPLFRRLHERLFPDQVQPAGSIH